jgi:transcriptional regulator with XRE-family HTH domain
MSKIMELVDFNLRTERIKKGISQVRLAGHTNISQSKISKVETGKLKLDVDELRLVLQCLGLKIKIVRDRK